MTVTRREIIETLFTGATGRVCVAEAYETAEGSGFVMREYKPRNRRSLEAATHLCAGTLGDQNNQNGNPYRSSGNIVETMVLPLDDVGTKAKVPALTPTMIVETKPGNFTYVYALSKGATPEQHTNIMASLIAAGYCDKNCGEAERLFRLPGSKPFDKEYVAELAAWNPEIKYVPDTILDLFEVEAVALAESEHETSGMIPAPPGVVVEDEVIAWLDERGMVRREGNDGFYEIECPWKDEWHSEEKKQTAKYKPATEDDIKRVFYCFHTHGQESGDWGDPHKTRQFLDWVRDAGGPDVDVTYSIKRELAELHTLIPEYDSGDWTYEQKSVPPKFTGSVYDEVAARMESVDSTGLPQPKLTAKGALAAVQIASPRNIEWLLGVMGATKKFNMMTQSVEWEFDERLGDLLNSQDASIATGAIMQVASQCDIATGAAEKILENMPSEKYHPMEDWILSLPDWDGRDYISELAAGLPVVDGYSEYTQAVVKRWLIQAVQAVRGWRGPEKQIPHVLVFCGPQGIGKTTWITNVAPREFTKDGATLNLSGSVSQHRDSVRAATQRAIVELGELETTFGKSEQGALKNFLSTVNDTYRPAYARHEITVRRCTVFAASVNSTTILRDQSGARRYWPLDLIKEQIPTVVDVEGIWAQANHLWENGESWFLTEAESALHDEIVERHTETSEVHELMAVKYPNGFTTAAVGRGGGIPDGCRILTVTDIQREIDMRGMVSRGDIRSYVEKNGGRWGKYSAADGRRVGNACVALPADTAGMEAVKKAILRSSISLVEK